MNYHGGDNHRCGKQLWENLLRFPTVQLPPIGRAVGGDKDDKRNTSTFTGFSSHAFVDVFSQFLRWLLAAATCATALVFPAVVPVVVVVPVVPVVVVVVA